MGDNKLTRKLKNMFTDAAESQKRYFAKKSDVASVYKPQGKAAVSSLNSLIKTASMNGYVYDCSTAGTLTNYDNTTIAVKTGDNVVFFWNNGDWYWDNFSGLIDLSGYQKKITFTKYEMTTAEAVTSIEYNLHNTATKVLYFIIDTGNVGLIPPQTATITLVVNNVNIATAAINFGNGNWKELYFKADCTTPVLERYYGAFRYNTYGINLWAATPRIIDVTSITKLTITFTGDGLPANCPFYVYEGVLA